MLMSLRDFDADSILANDSAKRAKRDSSGFILSVTMEHEAEEIERTIQTNPRQRCQRNGAASPR
jgi:hypothetical protein